jgi:hypothetical protein
MEYEIIVFDSGSQKSIKIEEDEFLKIRNARVYYFETIYLEDMLNLVTENYFEFEKELLSITAREMIFNENDYYYIQKCRNQIVRRIVNLLSACRMYFDHSYHHICNIYGKDSEIGDQFKKETESQYNQKFGYRVMEALRNYSQHRGIPFHVIRFSGNWQDIDSEEHSKLRFTVDPIIRVSNILKDGNFKPVILKEMLEKETKDGLDIRPLIREYIEGIGIIHEKLRELINKDVQNWEEILEKAIENGRNVVVGDDKPTIVYIMASGKEDQYIERISIFREFIERRRALVRRNCNFTNFRKRYASNEIPKKE